MGNIMIQNPAEIRLKAHNEYPIELLLQCSDIVDGSTYVLNRSKLLERGKDVRLLYVLMAAEYGWDYSERNNSTIYFVTTERGVVAGIYDTVKRIRKTQKDFLLYTYTENNS